MEAISIEFLIKILLACSIILSVYLSFNIIRIIKESQKLKKRKLDIKQYEIDIKTEIGKDINEMLDNMIEQCFQEYTILNLIYKSDYYIKEEEEIKINKDIANIVSQRLSDVFMKQLALYYKEESIPDIIAKRINFRVTNFVMEHNHSTGL
jgi:hypothetical protein